MSQVAEITVQNLRNQIESCEERKIELDKRLNGLKNAGLSLKKSYDAMQEARNEMLCCVSDKNLRDDLKVEIKSFKKIYEKTRELFDSTKTELNNLNDTIKALYSEKRIAEENLALIRIAEEKRTEELLAEERIAEEQLTSANASTSYSRRKPRVERDRISDWAKIPTGTVFLNTYKREHATYVKKGNLLCCVKTQRHYESLSHAMRDYLKERGHPNPTQSAWLFFKVLCNEKPIKIDQFLETI